MEDEQSHSVSPVAPSSGWQKRCEQRRERLRTTAGDYSASRSPRPNFRVLQAAGDDVSPTDTPVTPKADCDEKLTCTLRSSARWATRRAHLRASNVEFCSDAEKIRSLACSATTCGGSSSSASPPNFSSFQTRSTKEIKGLETVPETSQPIFEPCVDGSTGSQQPLVSDEAMSPRSSLADGGTGSPTGGLDLFSEEALKLPMRGRTRDRLSSVADDDSSGLDLSQKLSATGVGLYQRFSSVISVASEDFLANLESFLKDAEDPGDGEWYCVYGSDDDEETHQGRTRDWEEAEKQQSFLFVQTRKRMEFAANEARDNVRQRRLHRSQKRTAAALSKLAERPAAGRAPLPPVMEDAIGQEAASDDGNDILQAAASSESHLAQTPEANDCDVHESW
eukprot:TRINITY_DN14168_c0_g2_i1.p1 TRINITY_DN14168_c0_g2~~TRINITY_DN14168_c0_g2_i1.p1  ORF type:complete len:393 (+),score=59.34 TRINITY_DN14168_c0_g2_i1:198-1376(+)